MRKRYGMLLSLFALTAVPSVAAEFNPEGQWEVSTGESRYRITRCGDGGDELCAQLTWLRDDLKTAENLAQLNRYVVKGAKRIENNAWTGTLVFAGSSYRGTVRAVSSNAMRLDSCAGVLCKSVVLERR